MTTNTVVLLAVVIGAVLALVAMHVAVSYRFRADRRGRAGGSIVLDQAIHDVNEDYRTHPRARVEPTTD